jgi:hypothetical protein
LRDYGTREPEDVEWQSAYPHRLLDRFQQKLSVQKLRTQLDVSKRKEENFVRLPSWGLRSPPVVLIAGSPLFISFTKTLN